MWDAEGPVLDNTVAGPASYVCCGSAVVAAVPAIVTPLVIGAGIDR
jgi:hypothetical protein